jgi:tetratricopeptide (TPR) repeat protein
MKGSENKIADKDLEKSEPLPSHRPIARYLSNSQFMDAFAANLLAFLKAILILLILISIIFVFIKIYTQQGIVLQPFDVGKNEAISGVTIADQLTAELLRIKKIHSSRNMDETLSGNWSSLTAEIDSDMIDNSSVLVPKSEIIEFSLAETGTIDIGFGPFDPGKLIIAFKNICPGSKPDTTIRGSLQRYESSLFLVAVMEGSDVKSWIVKQPIDNGSEEQLHEMIRILAFMIVHEISQPKVSAKTWQGLQYYTEALDAYHQYKIKNDSKELAYAANSSLRAIISEKGYKYPFDMLGAVELAYLGIKDPINATYYCNRTIEIDPKSEFGYNNKGIVLYQIGRLEEAIQAYDTAIKINPRYAYAWNLKGMALDRLQEYKRAIKAYDRAIKINPKFKTAWHNKGNALYNLNEFDKAIDAYDEAIHINPQYAIALHNRGDAFYDQEKTELYDDAIDSYNKAIKADPMYAESWCDKGSVLLDLERYKEADLAFDKAIEIDPQYYDAWCEKGYALGAKGDYEAAIEALEEAMEIQPNSSTAWYYKGIVLKAQHNYERAIQACDRVLQIEPDHENAQSLKISSLVAKREQNFSRPYPFK